MKVGIINQLFTAEFVYSLYNFCTEKSLLNLLQTGNIMFFNVDLKNKNIFNSIINGNHAVILPTAHVFFYYGLHNHFYRKLLNCNQRGKQEFFI